MLWTAPGTWGIISSTIGKITCEKCPKSRMGADVKKKVNPNHAVHSTWWLGLFLGGGIICSTIGKITCEKWPQSRMGEQVKKKTTNHQMLWTAPDIWGIISSTIGKITCEKCPKSRMGADVKKKKLTPTIRCCSQHLMVGLIFRGRHNL